MRLSIEKPSAIDWEAALESSEAVRKATIELVEELSQDN